MFFPDLTEKIIGCNDSDKWEDVVNELKHQYDNKVAGDDDASVALSALAMHDELAVQDTNELAKKLRSMHNGHVKAGLMTNEVAWQATLEEVEELKNEFDANKENEGQPFYIREEGRLKAWFDRQSRLYSDPNWRKNDDLIAKQMTWKRQWINEEKKCILDQRLEQFRSIGIRFEQSQEHKSKAASAKASANRKRLREMAQERRMKRMKKQASNLQAT